MSLAALRRVYRVFKISMVVVSTACGGGGSGGGGGGGDGPDGGVQPPGPQPPGPQPDRPPSTGFEDSSLSWTLPATLLLPAVSDLAWFTFDLDGDRKPDLVRSATSASSTRVVWSDATGPYWKVHLNDGTGFAAETRWSVPASPGVESGFYAIAAQDFGENWTTMDIDGDGKSDLVWTSSAGSNVVWGGAADPHWKVFLNTGTGFAAETRWPVPPASGLSSGFFTTADTAFERRWSTLDINGDAKPDLVWTRTVDGVWGGAADPYWKVFLNTGTGFAAMATTWTVPQGPGLFGGFATTGSLEWTTLDLDGDSKPELVWTTDPGGAPDAPDTVWGGIAEPYWRVYKNTGTGFSASPMTWPVPPAPGVIGGFAAVAGLGWSTTDLDGDRRPDLIWHIDPSADPITGAIVFGGGVTPYWRVYTNTGTGFAASATRWPVPTSADYELGFFALANGQLGARWATMDLDGDGYQDLVWTSMTNGQVWMSSGPYWKLYRSRPGVAPR